MTADKLVTSSHYWTCKKCFTEDCIVSVHDQRLKLRWVLAFTLQEHFIFVLQHQLWKSEVNTAQVCLLSVCRSEVDWLLSTSCPPLSVWLMKLWVTCHHPSVHSSTCSSTLFTQGVWNISGSICLTQGWIFGFPSELTVLASFRPDCTRWGDF